MKKYNILTIISALATTACAPVVPVQASLPFIGEGNPIACVYILLGLAFVGLSNLAIDKAGL